MSVQGTILVIDDEIRSQEALRRVLRDDFEVLCASSAADAEKLLEGEIVHAILCDQRMPHESGVSFLKRVRELWPDPVRMIISGYSDSEDIIAGLNEAGIYQYITKPWQPERLVDIVKEAVQLYRLQKETETAGVDVKATPEHIKKVVSVKRGAAKQLYDFNRIVHSPDSPMHGVIELGRRAAEYDISVLITGESGTGKELLARAIHYGSARANKAFVVENCGALPDELLESELFGCKKGAFTGAYQDRIGLFEVADGGTIFLDEIGETSPAFQVKLLRVLQESEIRPLGAQRVRKVDVRVVAATNRDLEAEVEAGRFRRDLYYRLAAFPVHMPALRERPMDIGLIAERVLSSVKTAFNRPSLRFSASSVEAFAKYHWPGNVRELQNEIQRMAVLADADELRAPPLLGRSNGRRPATAVHGKLNGSATLKDKVEDLEKSVIISYLERYEGNISRVASELGLSRVGLRNKLSRYDLRKNAKGDAFPETGETESLLKLITNRGAIEFDHEREGAWIEVIRKMDEVYSDLLRYEVDLEHKNAELEEAQAFVTNVIESVSDILIVCDAKGLVQQVNSAFQHMLGRGVADIVGKNIAEVIDAADNARLVPLLKLRSASDVVDGELRFSSEGGSSDLFAINSSPRHDHRGRFIGVVLTGRPIGELRRAYEALHKAHHELQRAQRQLVEQEKMASLGRLVAGVAHELNNPISFVYGNIHTLMRYRTSMVAYLDAIHGKTETDDLGALKKNLRIDDILEDFGPLIEGTLEGAVRISEIVKNLRRLSFSKIGEVERVNIGRLINTAVLWAVRTKQVRIELQMEIEPELWISGNEGQLHQVIVNLVENAIDAMRGTELPRLVVSASRKGNEILLRISDNGPGIDKDHISHIFEPFFTTKRVGEGTGLGLWISYGIVREHGGELFAVNEPQGGATFSFALPAG